MKTMRLRCSLDESSIDETIRRQENVHTADIDKRILLSIEGNPERGGYTAVVTSPDQRRATDAGGSPTATRLRRACARARSRADDVCRRRVAPAQLGRRPCRV